MLKGDNKAEVTDVGLRFIIEVDGEELASAEALNRAKGQFQFGGLNEGPLVASFVAALKVVDVREQGFEPRLLLVPALNAAALWIGPEHSLREGGTIVPLEPAHPRLPPHRSMAASEYLSILQSLAAEVPVGGAKGGSRSRRKRKPASMRRTSVWCGTMHGSSSSDRNRPASSRRPAQTCRAE
jgi:hypothetical protein